MSDQPTSITQVETFKCPQCSAPRMDYDPAAGGLKCPQCGHAQSVEAAQAAVVEHDLTAALSDTGKARGYGREMKAITCKNCGATTQVDPTVASTTCPFCGSQQVLEQKPDPNIVQPESVIPFQFTSDEAYQKYKKWLGTGFFRPKDVLQKSGAAQIQGVYLPFWTFDAHAESRWTAESGDYYYETERYTDTENGKRVTKTRQVRKVRWYPTVPDQRGDRISGKPEQSSSRSRGSVAGRIMQPVVAEEDREDPTRTSSSYLVFKYATSKVSRSNRLAFHAMLASTP